MQTLTLKSNSNDPGDIVFTSGDNTEYGRIYAFPDKLYISAGSDAKQELTIVGSTGNVGIGVENPGEKLAVKGTILAIRVRVAQNWADYVFDSSYVLPSLNAVEAYIKQHKHLPQMPSAKEVEQKGLDMGAMVKSQQVKIEELTLYMISLEKRLKQQEQLIEELRKK